MPFSCIYCDHWSSLSHFACEQCTLQHVKESRLFKRYVNRLLSSSHQWWCSERCSPWYQLSHRQPAPTSFHAVYPKQHLYVGQTHGADAFDEGSFRSAFVLLFMVVCRTDVLWEARCLSHVSFRVQSTVRWQHLQNSLSPEA